MSVYVFQSVRKKWCFRSVLLVVLMRSSTGKGSLITCFAINLYSSFCASFECEIEGLNFESHEA